MFGGASFAGASSTEELSEIVYSAATALSEWSAMNESVDADPEQALIHFEESDSTSEDETANIAEFNRRFVFRIYFLNIFIYLNTVIKINILY